MSAIFGILRYDGEAASGRDLERMGNTLAHRGPDGRKFVVDGCAGLGHCLMRVNQEDHFEAQPIRDRAADLTLVADCRIDNREELAEQFGIGVVELHDMPDSALVLNAYKTWGEECAAHLIGDFAFAVWDGRAGKLVLGRDHMGQRNVFYHEGEGFFAFASEIKGLWALADVPRQIQDEEIARYFLKRLEQTREGSTLYSGICRLPGGTVIAVGQDGVTAKRRFWEPRADPAHEGQDEIYYIEKYRSVLAEAVACRLRRLSGPAALLLSAGFDSAAIAGLAGPTVTAQERKLIGLSWLGEHTTRTTRGDIRPWVEACRRVMPHLDVRELSRQSEHPFAGIERLFRMHDGPGGGARKTSGYLFAEAAAAGARLVMDGYGGDYTLNPRGLGALARHLRNGRFRRFFAELRPHLRETGQTPWQMLKHDIVLMLVPDALVRWQRRVRQIGSYALRASALDEVQGPYLKKLASREVAEAKPGIEAIPFVAMRARIRHVANRVRRAGAAGGAIGAAAHGLDLTRPFHDKRVIELALAIPEDLYVKDGHNRYLARVALANVYPPEFQTRGRRNDGALADEAILDLTAPDLSAEAGRMATSARISDYFDFERVQRILTVPDQPGAEAAKKAAAIRALSTARFIEWFSRSNA